MATAAIALMLAQQQRMLAEQARRERERREQEARIARERNNRHD